MIKAIETKWKGYRFRSMTPTPPISDHYARAHTGGEMTSQEPKP